MRSGYTSECRYTWACPVFSWLILLYLFVTYPLCVLDILSSLDIRGHFMPYVAGVSEEGHGCLGLTIHPDKSGYISYCLKHTLCINSDISVCAFLTSGHPVAQLVEALCYELGGRGFHSRLSHWNFSLT
jgi:hypothetical protein